MHSEMTQNVVCEAVYTVICVRLGGRDARLQLTLLQLASAAFCGAVHNQIIITVWRRIQSTNHD